MRIENRSRKNNRTDVTLLHFQPRDVGNVEPTRLPRGKKRCATAIIASDQRGLCRHQNPTLSVRSCERLVDRGVGRLQPLQILGEIFRIGWSQRHDSRQHDQIASAFEQHPIQLLGHFGRSQLKFFSRRLYKAMFDEPNQDDTGRNRHEGHTDQKIRQPSIAARNVDWYGLCRLHDSCAREATKLGINKAG